MKVSKICKILNDWMPTSISEDYDNVGLIVGDPHSLVSNILITLDATVDVVNEALKKDCNFIISYHPIIFKSFKKLTPDSGYVQKSIIKAVKNNICIYAIHTSLDNHPQGISYYLSKKLGLTNLSTLIPKNFKNNFLNTGMGVIGKFDDPLEENDFLDLLKDKLALSYLRHSKKLNKKISKVSIIAGSGSFAIKNSLNLNVDAFITSDLKYHNFFESDNKAIFVDIGHYESENHIKLIIKEFLTKKLPTFRLLLSEKNVNPVNYY